MQSSLTSTVILPSFNKVIFLLVSDILPVFINLLFLIEKGDYFTHLPVPCYFRIYLLFI